MRHARQAGTVAVLLIATVAIVSGCHDSPTGPPAPSSRSQGVAWSNDPAGMLVGAAAESALFENARIRAAHGDRRLFEKLRETRRRWGWDPDVRSLNAPRSVRIDAVRPLFDVWWNGSGYSWDGQIPADDHGPATFQEHVIDAGSPSDNAPAFASSWVAYHGDKARNDLQWQAKNDIGVEAAKGGVAPIGRGTDMCSDGPDSPWPFEYFGLVCRYHVFNTYVPVYNIGRCGITMTASGSHEAWFELPWGLSVTIGGKAVGIEFGTATWGWAAAGSPTATAPPTPCLETRRPGSGGGSGTEGGSTPPAPTVAWTPDYPPPVPFGARPVGRFWCQRTYYYLYGELWDVVAKCFNGLG